MKNLCWILVAALFLFTPASAVLWKLSYASPEQSITALQVYNGKFYAGTSSYGSVYVYDGKSWNLSYAGQAGYVSGFAVYDGKLYAVISGNLYVYENTSWNAVSGVPQDDSGSVVVYNNKLYMAESGGTSIFEYDGISWNRTFTIQQIAVRAMIMYDGKLYAGDVINGAIYVYDGTSWNTTYNTYESKWSVSYDTRDYAVKSFAVYDGKLYAGTENRANIYVYDGKSWTLSYGPAITVNSFTVYDGKLYVSGLDNILIYNGTWTDKSGMWCADRDGTGRTMGNIYALAVYNGKLYAGSASRGDICELDTASAPEPTPAQIDLPRIIVGSSSTVTPTPTPTPIPTSTATSVQCSNGCLYADSCIPFGTRLGPQYSVIPFNGTASYCDVAKKAIEPQKNDTSACQNSYECISNYCSNGACGNNLQKELSATRGLLEQILDFLRMFFGKFFPSPVAK